MVRRCRKFFTVNIKGKNESVSIDRLKPAFEMEGLSQKGKYKKGCSVLGGQLKLQQNYNQRHTISIVDRDSVTGGGFCGVIAGGNMA